MYCLFIIVDERDDDRVTETVDIVRRLKSKCRYIDIIIDYIITSREHRLWVYNYDTWLLATNKSNKTQFEPELP